MNHSQAVVLSNPVGIGLLTGIKTLMSFKAQIGSVIQGSSAQRDYTA